jgi:predicted nucleic acid-binding protein
LECLDLLRSLGKILVPRNVWEEVLRHRSNLAVGNVPNAETDDRVSVSPSPHLTAICDSLDLDVGERAAIGLMASASAGLLLCDDAAARLAAESLGFAVRGTIGVLVRSIRVGSRTREEVTGLLRQLPHKSSLHISRQLLATVIAEVQKPSTDM